MIRLEMPWPDQKLSPNARGHWAQTAKLKARQRSGWAWHATAQGVHTLRDMWTPEQIKGTTLRLTFHPPTRRMYDLDNRLASIKAGLDGLADTLGCDDSGWKIEMMMGDMRAGGCVVVEVTQ